MTSQNQVMKEKNICGRGQMSNKSDNNVWVVATIIKEADLRITAEACQDYINKSL